MVLIDMARFNFIALKISFTSDFVLVYAVISLLFTTGLINFNPVYAKDKSVTDNKNSDFERVAGELEELVKEFFPRAKFKKTAKGIHFEFKAKKSSAGPGSNRLILAPKVDGIVGDLTLKQGKYKTDKILPYRVNEMFWVSLLMAPYSEPDNSHLHTKILFPPQTPIGFINSLKDIVSSFQNESEKTQEVENKADSTEPEIKEEKKEKVSEFKGRAEKDVEAEEEMVVSIVSDGDTIEISDDEEKEKEEEEPKVDFGAPKFSSYSFSEGRFKIKLPGSPDVSASNRAGMRFVDYKYLEPQGLYNIGYAILPGRIREEKETHFLNTISQALIKASRGKVAKHHSLKWQGYPGRQIVIENLGGKKNRSSLLRIVLVKNYFYMLQAAGTTPWVKSDAVKTVLNSLEVRPPLTSRQKYRLKLEARERDRARRNYEYEARKRNKRPRYNHSWERRRADRKYNRRSF